MLNYTLIRKLIKEKGLTYNFVFSQIGYTKQGYKSAELNHTLTAKAVEIIAEILQVPVGVLFGEQPDQNFFNQGDQSPVSIGGAVSQKGTFSKGNGSGLAEKDNAKLKLLQEEVKALKEKVKIKDEMLQEKERTIQILMGK